ncbi:MAG: hypothetical protein HY286_16700 [Planctomycetes bacterium]|nr:hypothetical protein [Planctomycetota bacterium]
MQLRKFTITAAIAGGFCATAVAQDIFICSTSDMLLTRANDKNGNGTTNEPGEYTKAAYAPNKLKRGIDIKATSLFGAPALLWLDNDNSLKAVEVLRDTSGDGVYDDSEISTIVGSINTIMGASSAGNTFLSGLCEDGAGNLYVSNNQFSTTTPNSNGILRISNATTIPTTLIAWKQTDTVTIDENNTTPGSGTITTKGGSAERLACNMSANTVYAYHTKDDCFYALKDLDGDGKFTSAGECINFLNLSGHKAGITRSVDFSAGGTYAARGNDFASVIPSATNGNYTADYSIEVDQVNGAVVMGFRNQPQNPGSTDISGVIIVCKDLNGNGTCNDAGETTTYVDQAHMGGGTFVYNGIQYKPDQSAPPGLSGLAVRDVAGATEVYCTGNIGPQDKSGNYTCDIVWKFVDLDNDGLAMSAGEQIPICVQRPAGSVSQELEVTDLPFTPNFATCSNFQTPGAQAPLNVTGVDANGLTLPCLSAGGLNLNLKPGIRFYKNAPYVGNPDFQVSVTGCQFGSDFAQLWYSQAQWDIPAVGNFFNLLCQYGIFCGPTPNDPNNLDEWLPLGVWNSPSPMYVDLFGLLDPATAYVDFTGSGITAVGDPITGGTAGTQCTPNVGTTKVPYSGRFDYSFAVPNNPGLKGSTFYLQWHVLDPTGTGSPNAGFPFPRAVSDQGIVVIN